MIFPRKKNRLAPGEKREVTKTDSFSQEDVTDMESLGISPRRVKAQLSLYRRSVGLLRLNRPCTLGDGILKIPEGEIGSFIALQEKAAREGRFSKFIPASGAATRMFQTLMTPSCGRGENHGREDPSASSAAAFCEALPRFPFYEDLKGVMARAGDDLEECLAQRKWEKIIEYVLFQPGLGYLNLPKGMHLFHRYPDGNRTAFEEHLVEASRIVRDKNGLCRVHITCSPEQQKIVRSFLKKVQAGYEKRCRCRFQISYSVQSPASNILAVDLNNRPFRDERGKLLFRPAGHGALLNNLNRLKGDLIYIKNIDNIQPDRSKDTTVLWKKILGGFLLRVEEEVHRLLRELTGGRDAPSFLREVETIGRERLCFDYPLDFSRRPTAERRAFFLRRLNRPIRVCGMVRNEGEPGGGPFWVEGKDGRLSLQIVEKVQVDTQSPEQRACLGASSHFNPVDLVCSVRDFQGKPFNLKRFSDPEAVFITRKSYRGRELKALELPGLWNGAMADWITLFVEVPNETFTPVKTVFDLLRPEHQNEG